VYCDWYGRGLLGRKANGDSCVGDDGGYDDEPDAVETDERKREPADDDGSFSSEARADDAACQAAEQAEMTFASASWLIGRGHDSSSRVAPASPGPSSTRRSARGAP